MSRIIDGKLFAQRLREFIGQQVAIIKTEHGVVPGLEPYWWDRMQPPRSTCATRRAKRLKPAWFKHTLDAATSEAELLGLIADLNADEDVHGILVQLPLPAHITAERVINAIDPRKDVDGFHVSNVGMLGTGQPAMLPCTPLGCMMLLREQFGSLTGKNALVVGRSNIVGKPMAQLLLADNCTVTIAHRYSENLCVPLLISSRQCRDDISQNGIVSSARFVGVPRQINELCEEPNDKGCGHSSKSDFQNDRIRISRNRVSVWHST
jgi:methylenetetrahydrofolate dehydrogenase (NADP+)/methenyltetrahydrofolate cyclohydrolase